MSTLLINAEAYARRVHTETNHLYDGEPYADAHLKRVVDYALKYIEIIPIIDRDRVLSAAWCHDVIEDCRQTYTDVRRATDVFVAEIVYALTNEKGRNRRKRANLNYYRGIQDTQYASFVKICDRLANVNYAVTTGLGKDSGMAHCYRIEAEFFRHQLWKPAFDDMFQELEYLLYNETV